MLKNHFLWFLSVSILQTSKRLYLYCNIIKTIYNCWKEFQQFHLNFEKYFTISVCLEPIFLSTQERGMTILKLQQGSEQFLCIFKIALGLEKKYLLKFSRTTKIFNVLAFLLVSHLRLSQLRDDPVLGWMNHFIVITLYQQQPNGTMYNVTTFFIPKHKWGLIPLLPG